MRVCVHVCQRLHVKWQESWEPVCACVFVYDKVSVFVYVGGVFVKNV